MHKNSYILFITILVPFLISTSLSQTLISAGEVYGTWDYAGSPYQVQGDITIPNDSTLIIEPGVSVIFWDHYGLFVQGRLLAIGNETYNITFTTDDTIGFHDPDITQGGWNGIQFIDTPTENDTSKFIYCILQYGKAVDHEGGAIYISNFDKVLISSSTISHNSAGGTDLPVGGGISLHNANIVLNENEISHNHAVDGGGILIWESDPVFNNNVIEFNTASQTGGGVWIGGISNTNFNGDIISHNFTDGNGGGVICWQATKTVFDSVNITNNIGRYGGGANFNDCDVQINNCKISDNSSAWIGGGIHAYSCNLEINNTSFERDTAFVFGGAMGIYFSELTINNSNLINNSARNLGGGIHSDGSNINISKTLFNRDTTAGSGGAVFNWLCQAQFNNCDFIENSALNGGAISSSNSDLLIDSSSFFKNLSKNQGGALEYIADTSGFTSITQLEITNSTFEENVAYTRCGAALIEQYNSNQPLAQLKIDNCDFINNKALHVGVLRVGNISGFILSNSKFIGNSVTQYTAACTFAQYSSGSVYNSLFAKNIAGKGTSGGVGVSNNAEVDFMNCTFTSNSSGSGGGIHIRQGGTATLTNSILWGNYPDQISLLAVNDTSACTIYLNYNDIQFGVDSINVNDTISVINWGVGNINSDPLFVDTLSSNYHLQTISPCLSTGIDSIEVGGLWQHTPLTDIEGNPRPSPSGTMPDMGVYESQHIVQVKDDNLNIPIEYALFQNYPNPFNPITKIKYSIPTSSLVILKIYDILGREIEILINEEKPAGDYEVEFDGGEITSGIYFYRIQAGDYVETKKMVLMK